MDWMVNVDFNKLLVTLELLASSNAPSWLLRCLTMTRGKTNMPEVTSKAPAK